MPVMQTFAQQTISGIVSDSVSGAPLSGVSVLVQGTSSGTSTDLNGAYTISVTEDEVRLVVSFLGYSTKTVTAQSGSTGVNILLSPGTESLDEIVVIGYGSVKRADLTGSVAQLDAETFEDRPITRIEQAFQGQMAGVQVRTTTGQPGQPLEIRVRGGASISAGNEPLYVVDGVPVSDMGDINPNDIASIEVLKDAASSAIYGSRGANGVVLITTKSGEAGKTRFQFSAYYGVQQLESKLDLLSGQEWIDMYMQAQDSAWVNLGRQEGLDYQASDPIAFRQAQLGVERNAGYIADPRWLLHNSDSLAYLDWQDAFFGSAPVQDYQLSASGGTEKLRYRISGNYFNQDGIAAYTNYQRMSLRVNLDAKLNDYLDIGLDLAPSRSWSRGGNVDGKDQIAHQVMSISPVAEPEAGTETGVKPYETYYWAGSPVSPVAYQREVTNEAERQRLFSSLYLNAKLYEGLNLKVTGSWNTDAEDNDRYYPTHVQRRNTNREEGELSDGRFYTRDAEKYLFESLLTYDRSFGDHTLGVLAGYTAERYNIHRSYQRHTEFPDDLLEVINENTSTVTNSETSALERTLLSYLGRVTYNYMGRYLATASIRRDGSSIFGKGNRWGYFPSFSLGWRVSDEPFMQEVNWISNLKLRYSWGKNGNNGIPDYAAIGRVGVYNYSFGNELNVGYGPSSLSNPNLGWEKTRSSNYGLDLGLFRNRLFLSADYYYKLTSDLLLEVPLALSTGFETGFQNLGKVENRGLELELTSRNFTGKFNWETFANISFNENKVLKLGTGDAPIYTGFSNSTAIIKVGEPLLSYYMYDAIGVYKNQEDLENSPRMENNIVGDVKYRDTNGDGTITPDDRTILGQRAPMFTWGINNYFSYRNFDLSFLIQGQKGNLIYSILGRAIDRPGMGNRGNALGRWRDRWRSEAQPGDGHTPRIDGTTSSFYDSRWLYDASYWRLKNVTLGYNLPAGAVKGVSSARIFASGENLFLHDHYYGGFSPEAENNEGGDYGGYPIATTFTIGVNMSF